MIHDRKPDQLQFPFALWTREAVRELIKKLFGIDYLLNMLGVLLADWGFTPQEPIVRSLERNDEAMRKWLEVDYPKIKNEQSVKKLRFIGKMRLALAAITKPADLTPERVRLRSYVVPENGLAVTSSQGLIIEVG